MNYKPKQAIREESKRPFIYPTKDVDEWQKKLWKDMNKAWC